MALLPRISPPPPTVIYSPGTLTAPGSVPKARTAPLLVMPRFWATGRKSINTVPSFIAAFTSSVVAISSGRKFALNVLVSGFAALVSSGFTLSDSQAVMPPFRIDTSSWPSTLKVQ